MERDVASFRKSPRERQPAMPAHTSNAKIQEAEAGFCHDFKASVGYTVSKHQVSKTPDQVEKTKTPHNNDGSNT